MAPGRCCSTRSRMSTPTTWAPRTASTTWPTCTPRRERTASPCRSTTTTRDETATGRRAASPPGTTTTCTRSTATRRPPARPGLGLSRRWRRHGRLQRQPQHTGVRGRVRRRLLRPVGRKGLRRLAQHRQRGLRAAVLSDQRGQRHQDPEHLHDVRRDLVGAGCPPPSSTPPTTTAPPSPRAAS